MVCLNAQITDILGTLTRSLSMAKKQLVDAYFRVLNLAQAVQALPSVSKLDAAEERLLEALTAAWHAGRTLTVTETMALFRGGRPGHRASQAHASEGTGPRHPRRNQCRPAH